MIERQKTLIGRLSPRKKQQNFLITRHKKAIIARLSFLEERLFWISALLRLYQAEDYLLFFRSRIAWLRKMIFSDEYVGRVEMGLFNLEQEIDNCIEKPELKFPRRIRPMFPLEEIYIGDSERFMKGVDVKNPDYLLIQTRISWFLEEFWRMTIEEDGPFELMDYRFFDYHFGNRFKVESVVVDGPREVRVFEVIEESTHTVRLKAELNGIRLTIHKGTFAEVQTFFEMLFEAVSFWNRQEIAKKRRSQFGVLERPEVAIRKKAVEDLKQINEITPWLKAMDVEYEMSGKFRELTQRIRAFRILIDSNDFNILKIAHADIEELLGHIWSVLKNPSRFLRKRPKRLYSLSEISVDLEYLFEGDVFHNPDIERINQRITELIVWFQAIFYKEIINSVLKNGKISLFQDDFSCKIFLLYNSGIISIHTQDKKASIRIQYLSASSKFVLTSLSGKLGDIENLLKELVRRWRSRRGKLLAFIINKNPRGLNAKPQKEMGKLIRL